MRRLPTMGVCEQDEGVLQRQQPCLIRTRVMPVVPPLMLDHTQASCRHILVTVGRKVMKQRGHQAIRPRRCIQRVRH